MSPISFSFKAHSWPLARPFGISRGVKTQADVVHVTLSQGVHSCTAECVPYPHYGENQASVIAQLESVADHVASGVTAQQLLDLLPAGAARNALDCALLGLLARTRQVSLAEYLDVTLPRSVTTAVTISLDSPDAMAEQTRQEVAAGAKLLKVKLNEQQIIERVSAVRDNAPQASLIVDANEAWTLETLNACHQQLADLGVEMIEQPLAAGKDDELLGFNSAVALCADESCHTRAELAYCTGRYQMVNIKLDKSGGLTEALALAKAAQEHDLEIMIGCMVGSSLAMQPALLLAEQARFVDLDGPLWLKDDYQPALRIEQGVIYP